MGKSEIELLDIALSLLTDDALMLAHDFSVLGHDPKRAQGIAALISYKESREWKKQKEADS